MATQLAESALNAFAALAEGRYDGAASAWCQLPDVSAAPSALEAVALNNVAVACLIRGKRVRAKALLERAADVAASLRADAAAESPALRGTSSSFHFRLAAKHTTWFASAANARRAHTASAIEAVITHHLALATARSGWRTEEISQSLGKACGATSAEVSLLHACHRSEIAAAYASRVFRLRQASVASVTSERQRLELSLAAMGILPPALVGAASSSADIELTQAIP